MATSATTTVATPQLHTQVAARLDSIKNSASQWFGKCVEAIDPRNIDVNAVKSNALHIALHVAEFITDWVIIAATATAIAGLVLASVACPISMIGTIPGLAGVAYLFLQAMDFLDRKFEESHGNVERLINPQTQVTA